MPMGLRDHDVAAGDATKHPLELGDVVEGRVANHLVDRKIIERHLWLGLHGRDTSVGLERTKEGRDGRRDGHGRSSGTEKHPLLRQQTVCGTTGRVCRMGSLAVSTG
jgi:hypothetical protein